MTLVLIFFLLIIQIETIRRIWVGAVAQLAAFASVRIAVFQGEKHHDIFAENLISTALPKWRKKDHFSKISLQRMESRSKGKVTSKYHLKYPALMKFREEGVVKLKFEVTERCHFPFLYGY